MAARSRACWTAISNKDKKRGALHKRSLFFWGRQVRDFRLRFLFAPQACEEACVSGNPAFFAFWLSIVYN